MKDRILDILGETGHPPCLAKRYRHDGRSQEPSAALQAGLFELARLDLDEGYERLGSCPADLPAPPAF